MKRVNSTQVAKKAGVAQSTVSLVINNDSRVSADTRARVIAAARELGYVLDPQNKKRLIGILLSGYRALDSYQSMVLTALQNAIQARSYRMEVINADNVELLNECSVCGAISISGDPELNQRWAALKNIPLIRFSIQGNHLDNIYTVYSDSKYNMSLIFDYLHRMGHSRIALLMKRSREQEERVKDKICHDFLELLQLSGIKSPETLVSFEDGSSLEDRLEYLLAQNITALVVFPGDTALEIQNMLKKRKIHIPDDLSMVSREFRNVSEFMDPPMTTILQNYPAMAEAALNMLEQYFGHCGHLEDIACPGSLIIRDSVRRI